MEYEEIKVIKKYKVIFWQIPLSMNHGDFIKSRLKFRLPLDEFEECFICEYRFTNDSKPRIMSIYKIGNRFICDKCYEQREV